MKTRAQVQTQIFVYAIAAIVVTLIMIYGYTAIQKMREQAEDVAYIKFKTDLENAVKTLSYATPGDVDKLELQLPKGYREICFVDVEKAATNNGAFVNRPIISSSVGTAKENVF